MELARRAGRQIGPFYPWRNFGNHPGKRKGGPRGDLGRPLFETVGAVVHRQSTRPSRHH